MTNYPAPNPPFIGARHHGGSQKPKAIVLHGTVSSDNAGTARNIANWWHGPGSPVTSAHYIVDPREVIQTVGDHTVAYHCGYNTGSIGVELCDEQQGPASRWQDADSKAILARAARLVAQLCLAYDIKPERPSIADLKRKGPHGIYGHNDSRLAFGHTTHTDPRDFPWSQFLGMVRAEVAAIKGDTVKRIKYKSWRGTTFSFTNVGRGRPGPQSTAFEKVEKWHPRGSHGFAEVGEADKGVDEPRIFGRTFGKGWRRIKVKTKHPIALRLNKLFKITGTSAPLGVHGEPHSWPNRYLTTAKWRRLGSKHRTAHVNTHFPPGAFNNKRERNQERRVEAWNEHWGHLRDHVTDLASRGFDVVVTGDFNRRGEFPSLHPRARLVVKHGVDRMYVIPAAGRKAEVVDSGTEPIGVDFHRHIWARIRFVNVKKRG